MRKGIFVVGTGTDVGKTYVTGLILKKLSESGVSAAYYKAAMSGNLRQQDGTLLPGDALAVRQMSGIDQSPEEMCPYVYEHAVSPHLAAALEGNPVQLEQVLDGFERLRQKYEYITMEGSGGILCPIRGGAQKLWLTDLIKACALSCLLVADAGLGTINSVGLTAFYMREQGIPLKGIIFNRFKPQDAMHLDNLQMCEELTGVPVIAQVTENQNHLNITAEQLMNLYE